MEYIGGTAMRYLIQLVAMLADLVLIGACSVALYSVLFIFPANIIVLYLVIRCFQAWQEEGGFEAWNPEVIKQFMANAKRIGL